MSTFRYFAYGSNLWPPRMTSRCPSAKVVTTATLEGWSLTYDKPSTDGSAKLNIRPDPSGAVEGVIYEIADNERQALDKSEPGYTPIQVEIEGQPAHTYTYEGDPFEGRPYDWYVTIAVAGARHHGIDPGFLDVETDPDQLG